MKLYFQTRFKCILSSQTWCQAIVQIWQQMTPSQRRMRLFTSNQQSIILQWRVNVVLFLHHTQHQWTQHLLKTKSWQSRKIPWNLIYLITRKTNMEEWSRTLMIFHLNQAMIHFRSVPWWKKLKGNWNDFQARKEKKWVRYKNLKLTWLKTKITLLLFFLSTLLTIGKDSLKLRIYLLKLRPINFLKSQYSRR